MKRGKLLISLLYGLIVLAGCTKMDLLNATIPSSGYTIIKDIPYREGDRGRLDIYVPDHLEKGHPVVFFSYGGSWKEGNKNDYLFIGQAFASKGMITVIADYRVYPEVYFPTFLEDSAKGLVWTHQHIHEYGGNPHNLFLVGHSAGAYNSVMLSLNRAFIISEGGDETWIKGTVGIAGPYDFLPLTDPILASIFSKREIFSTQPIHYARPHAPPLLLLTGDSDEDVLPQNSYNLAERLRTFENRVSVKTYPDITHIGIALSFADGFRSKAPVLADTVDFIKKLTVQ